MRNLPRAARYVAFLATASLPTLAPTAARADSLTTDETARLAAGATVIREQTWEAGDRRYVGGITYTLVDATMAELGALFEDVSAYRRVLPRTRTARLVGTEGGDRLIELVQGTTMMQASYTIRVRKRDATDASELCFWLDPTRPHGIDDAWGFFRAERASRSRAREEQRVLLTYGALVDVGPGIVRQFFEERLRAALLSVPQLVRRYMAELPDRERARKAKSGAM